MKNLFTVLEILSLAAWRLLVVVSLMFSLITVTGLLSLKERSPEKLKQIMVEIYFDGVPQEEIKTVTIGE